MFGGVTYRTAATLLLAVLAAAVTAVIVRHYRIESFDTTTTAAAAASSSSIKFLFFSASWCPHCRANMAAWQDFVSSKCDADGVYTNRATGDRVTCVNVDCSESTPDSTTQQQMAVYNVTKFPTFILDNAGKTSEYSLTSTPTTTTSLETFINNSL